MAPLILHNVPDDECYIGEDGVKRPYAMVFSQQDGPTGGSTRARRAAAETGSFGKSTRRSRSRTGTPARGRENPTLAAADKLFGDWVSSQQAAAAQQNTGTSQSQQHEETPQSASQSQQQQQKQALQQPRSQPTQMILRGYRSTTQQYAAIAHYETLAGVILEDYPREPPVSQRRYKSQLRDPAYTRQRTLSREELTLVNCADAGEHWVKVTFESSDAAETAMYASPQRILGHLVYAEPYRGLPPARDEACPDLDGLMDDEMDTRSKSVPAAFGATPKRTGSTSGPTSWHSRLIDNQNSPSNSSQTLETGTISSATATEPLGLGPMMNLPTGGAAASSSAIKPMEIEDDIFCRRIPTARRAQLLPAEQALRPQQSVMQRFVSAVPFLGWFGGSIIGNEVPRTETGEFDWNRASLYWKIIWWLDITFGLFKGDVSSFDKDD
ncbi:hypothetical protein GMORB2_7144 [Geosmithia morbida]|uniref:Nup53p-like protein n=1 Tax=Geosmithia morbida TaxID=1094350 RepID=A0A9P5D1K0_9HYPO|nr:uncharacterized protein GMORB2_7144 [Geosmithia morbida]KAF4122837.1 hypothetical protein GMORB2_7144 [Geosmithia morbida]